MQAGPANHQLRVTERRQLEARQRGTLTKGQEEATLGEGCAAFDGWTLVRSMRRWRRAGERERPRWGREAVATWAREEAEAARCLVCLRHAGLDPTQERDVSDGREAAPPLRRPSEKVGR